MNITWYMSDLHACGHVRGEVLARTINKDDPENLIVCKTDMLASDYYKTNLMVFQRMHSTIGLHKMLAAQERGIKCVCEWDDDPFHIPERFEQPFNFYAQPNVRMNIKAYLKCADAITVSTGTLAKEFAKRTDRPIYILDNSLDIEMWRGWQQRERKGITIGWMASGSHTIDSPLVIDAIHQAMVKHPEVNLHLIGLVGWEQLGERFKVFGDRVQFEPWVDIFELPPAMSDIDIGLAPLMDNQFNRCKSNIKWLQYAAAGAATLASNLEPYKDIRTGKDGVLVDDDGWDEAIEDLVVNTAKRESLAKQALQRVYSDYDIQRNARLWISVFEKVRN